MFHTAGTLWKKYESYFTGNPKRDAVSYLLVLIFFLAITIQAITAELFVDYWGCQLPPDTRVYQNSMYNSDPCLDVRFKEILFMSRREAGHVRRILWSILMGSLIGYERRSPDRPAGIRTMSITALGSCTFTLSSMFAFQSGPMAWDASRVSAAIPSGVGFLGAGLIWKGWIKGEDQDDVHQVHGKSQSSPVRPPCNLTTRNAPRRDPS